MLRPSLPRWRSARLQSGRSEALFDALVDVKQASAPCGLLVQQQVACDHYLRVCVVLSLHAMHEPINLAHHVNLINPQLI